MVGAMGVASVSHIISNFTFRIMYLIQFVFNNRVNLSIIKLSIPTYLKIKLS